MGVHVPANIVVGVEGDMLLEMKAIVADKDSGGTPALLP